MNYESPTSRLQDVIAEEEWVVESASTFVTQ